jgi:hypothetical protein
MTDWRILLELMRLVRRGQSIGGAYDTLAASTGLPKDRLVNVYCRAKVKRVNGFVAGKRPANNRDAG